MHILRNLLALAAAALALTGCKEAINEQHIATFLPSGVSGYTLYADQAEATLDGATGNAFGLFVSDSWSMTVSSPWLEVSPRSRTVTSTKDFATNLTLTAGVNDTGRTRTAMLAVTTTEFSQISCPVRQLPYLHIARPGNSSDEADRAEFTLRLPAKGAQADIAFYVHSEGARLTASDEWLQAFNQSDLAVYEYYKEEVGGEEKDLKRYLRHEITASVPDNTTGAERRGVIRLTSAGVTSEITVIQAAPAPGQER